MAATRKRGGTGSNGGRPKAKATAAKAREKVAARRDVAEGLEGAIADRAGDWSLEDRSRAWVEGQKYIANP